MAEKKLEMCGIYKSFGGVHALKDVSFNAVRGKVNVLMGENGAGKSTLMRVLAGAITMDEGKILIDQQEMTIADPKDAKEAGIAMIYQELNLVPQLSVETNIMLGRELADGIGFVKRAEAVRYTQGILDEYELEIDAKSEVGSLSIAEQQMVEIAKAIASGAQIIVMDEPTSSLTSKEVKSLFQIIRRLIADDKTVIYISHRMEEIYEIGDYITVMRDGTLVGEWPVSEVTQQDLIASMVGRDIANMYHKEQVPIGEEVLRVEGLSVDGLFNDISFSVRSGEILGLSGLVGAGRTEVAMTIYGAIRADRGEVFLRGEKLQIRTPADAIGKNIIYVPEDRKKLALDLGAKISDNIALGNMDTLCNATGFVDRKKEEKLCDEQRERFRIKATDMSLPANSLSGGNQQKVVLAKWLARDIDVLIMDEPTRGIDVGSKEEIHSLIVEMARAGKAIIMISSELPEILGLSDRILVMYEGRCMKILDAEDATDERVLAYSFGQTDEEKGGRDE